MSEFDNRDLEDQKYEDRIENEPETPQAETSLTETSEPEVSEARPDEEIIDVPAEPDQRERFSYKGPEADGQRERFSYKGSGTDDPRERFSYKDSGERYSYRDSGTGDSVGKKGSSLGRKIVKLIAGAAVFGLVAGATATGVNKVSNHLFGAASTEQIEVTTNQDNAGEENAGTGSGTDSSQESAGSNITAGADTSAGQATGSAAITTTDVSAVVEQVMPSVVSITGMYQTTSYFGQTTQAEGAGSGFIIAKTKDKLMIATNAHVVAQSTSLKVAFSDGSTAPATIVGQDTEADLAVISVDLKEVKDETSKVIKVAVLDAAEDLKVGQSVIAIGNALGYGQSVTTGVISALNREVAFTDGTMTLLQTDAAINPGNSGGVLIDTRGNVIGINNAKLSDTEVEGMGYAIPISTAKPILEGLMNAEAIAEKDQAFLGVVGKTIDSTYSEQLNMPAGIYVTEVISGSPAESAGISYGDIIVKFNGNKVSTMNGLKEKISLIKAGKEVTVTVKRANQNGEYEDKDIKVTLGKKSDFDTSEIGSENQNGQDGQNGQNGQNGNGWNGQDGQNGQNGNGGNYDENSGNWTNPYEYFFNEDGNGSVNPYDFFFNY